MGGPFVITVAKSFLLLLLLLLGEKRCVENLEEFGLSGSVDAIAHEGFLHLGEMAYVPHFEDHAKGKGLSEARKRGKES